MTAGGRSDYMSDDRPLPKPSVRPEPNNPDTGNSVPAWQIALVFALIIAVGLLVMVGGQ